MPGGEKPGIFFMRCSEPPKNAQLPVWFNVHREHALKWPPARPGAYGERCGSERPKDAQLPAWRSIHRVGFRMHREEEDKKCTQNYGGRKEEEASSLVRGGQGVLPAGRG